jgi:hypothetical protein
MAMQQPPLARQAQLLRQRLRQAEEPQMPQMPQEPLLQPLPLAQLRPL